MLIVAMPSGDLEESNVEAGIKVPASEVEEASRGLTPRLKHVNRLPPLVISSDDQGPSPRPRKKKHKKPRTPTSNGDSHLSDNSESVSNGHNGHEAKHDHSYINPATQLEDEEIESPQPVGNAPKERTPTELFMQRPTSADSSKSVKFKHSSETITFEKNSAVSTRGKGKGKKRPGSASSDTPTGSKTSLRAPYDSPAPSTHSNDSPPFSLEPKVVIEELSSSTPMNKLDVATTSKHVDNFTPSGLFQGGSTPRERPATASKVVFQIDDKPRVNRPKSAQKHRPTKKAPEPEVRPWFRKSRTTQSKVSPHIYTSVALVVCCNIFGIPALVASVLSYKALKRGDEEDGRRYSKLAKIYTGAAIALGILITLIVLIIYGVRFKTDA